MRCAIFELTNEQRKCFALTPVDESWKRVIMKPAPSDDFETAAYIDGAVIRKCVQCGENHYIETDYCERVSDDFSLLLPVTQKGKAQKLTAAALTKRSGRGMCLSFDGEYVSLFSCVSNKYYYSNIHASDIPGCFCKHNIENFAAWVENWCADTSEEDIADVSAFSKEGRSHARYKEGDVFRLKIGRRQYGETYIRREKGTCFGNFLNHGIGFSLSFKTEILRECIDKNSNAPYWERGGYRTECDLRNPKYKQQLETVCKHYGIVVTENE